ncbi:hypothetical protein ACH5RR_021061 [Cinchona calisaya]|uniref:Chromo domain-containing protein n=1 Tax=Cinchona calisaya TaxID=153742 RepID=A0ABD2ZG83_9GENT
MLVSAITVEKSIPPRDGLLYVQAKVNGIDVLAMVDTRTTHSFVTGREVCQLKLELKEHGLMAVLLDDFDLILGKDFLATNKIFPIPHLDGVMIADGRCPTFIPSVFVNTNASAGSSSSNERDKRGRRQAKPTPLVIWKQFEKEAYKVSDHKTMGQSKKNQRTDYLIYWKGETEADATGERI